MTTDLDAIDALAEAATPGEWVTMDCVPWVSNKRDAVLIIALRNAWPAVSAELRAAREVVAAADDFHQWWLGELGAEDDQRSEAMLVQALDAYRAATGQ